MIDKSSGTNLCQLILWCVHTSGKDVQSNGNSFRRQLQFDSPGYSGDAILLIASYITLCTFGQCHNCLRPCHLITFDDCSITHLSKRWQSDKVKVKINCDTNLRVHCVMQLSLRYKVFKMASLSNRLQLQLASQLPTLVM